MHRVDGNPWSGRDPEAEWWTGPTGAFPTVGKTSPGGAVTVQDTPIGLEPPTAPEAPVAASGPDQVAAATPAAVKPPTRRRPVKASGAGKSGAGKSGAGKSGAGKSDTTAKASQSSHSAPVAPAATPAKATASRRARRTTTTTDEPSPAPPTALNLEGQGDDAESARTAGADDVATAAGPADLDDGPLLHLDILGYEPEPVDQYDEPTDDVLVGRSATPAGNSDEQDDQGHGHDGLVGAVPEVMVLPEHPRDRPTVALPRGPVPGQSQRHDSAVAHGGASPAGSTRREYRVGQGRPDAARLQAIEESTFWQRTEDVFETDGAPDSDTGPMPAAPSRIGVPPKRRERPRTPRSPFVGLAALVVAALVAAFFAWVSAEPIWLAVGHARTGTATVTGCTGNGIGQRCEGSFSDGTVTSSPVALLGVDAAERHPGVTMPARMVRTDGRQAFVGGSNLMVHLRWTIGVLLLLFCGLTIAGATGARQLESARARRRAVLLSLTGPLLLLAGFLYASY